VKRIEVASVRSDDNFNDAYAKLIGTDSTNGIRARIEIHKEGKSGPSGTWASAVEPGCRPAYAVLQAGIAGRYAARAR